MANVCYSASSVNHKVNHFVWSLYVFWHLHSQFSNKAVKYFWNQIVAIVDSCLALLILGCYIVWVSSPILCVSFEIFRIEIHHVFWFLVASLFSFSSPILIIEFLCLFCTFLLFFHDSLLCYKRLIPLRMNSCYTLNILLMIRCLVFVSCTICWFFIFFFNETVSTFYN